MKKISLLIFVFGATVLGILVFTFWQSGLFYRPVIGQQNLGPLFLVFEKQKGPYAQTPKMIEDVYYRLVSRHKIRAARGFGIFLDDPRKTPPEKLSSLAGCLLEAPEYSKIAQLRKNFNLMSLSGANRVAAEFPYQNRLAVLIGRAKVYPLINRCFADQGRPAGPVMEIYDYPAQKIIFLALAPTDPAF